jgi:hypothetical protein
MLKALFIVFSITFLAGCQSAQFGDYTYDDFPWIMRWEELETLGFDEERTMVYYYNRDFFGTDCLGCVLINEALFRYGAENTDDVSLYLVNERTVQGIRPTGLRGQPTLFWVQEGIIEARLFGAGPILAFIESLEAGDVDWDTLEWE